MTIRPIDLQVLIPKASEISRVSHTQEIQAQNQQQQFAAQFEQAVQTRQKRVLESNQAQGQRVRSDKESRGRGQKENTDKDNKRNNPEATKEEGTGYVKPGLGSHVDIKT